MDTNWINYNNVIVCPLAIYEHLKDECARIHQLEIEKYKSITSCYVKSTDYSNRLPEILFSLKSNDMEFTFAKSMPEILFQEIKTAPKRKIKNKWYYFIDSYKPTIVIDKKTRNLFLKQLNQIINDPENKYRINKFYIYSNIKELDKKDKELFINTLNHYIGCFWPKSENLILNQIKLFLKTKGFDNYDQPRIKLICDAYGCIDMILYPINISRFN